MPYNKSKKRQIESASDEEQQVVKKSRSEKTAKKDLTQGKDADGNPSWEVGLPIILNISSGCSGLLTPFKISKNRRISTSQFKGTTLVNIREYYTAPDGELKPGKKVSYAVCLCSVVAINPHTREYRSP